jgi:hypothetical protein
MAICDFGMRFTFTIIGWPGSAHDTRILNHSVPKHAHKFSFPDEDNEDPMKEKVKPNFRTPPS